MLKRVSAFLLLRVLQSKACQKNISEFLAWAKMNIVASLTIAVELDLINCGVDHEIDVSTGNVTLDKYPWSGILYYLDYVQGEVRAVTTVVLIHKEFVLAAAADIGPLSKRHFRKSSRVLLGEDWEAPGRRVRNYVIHPEYGETYNTLALIQLTDIVRNPTIKPLCPPPEMLRKPKFYVVKFDEDYKTLQKQVHKVEHIPGGWCKDFYVGANLYSERMRPPHVACALSLQMQYPCVWHAGAALVSRDVWGRWQLLGFGVRGPGCGVPSRYLDLMSYDPWIRSSLRKFQRITITKINKQKYILRSASAAAQRFGACDAEETRNIIFRESIVLRTDNNQYQFLTYNMTLYNNIDYKCITLELINASAVSEMRITHYCTRFSHGPACYAYKGSVLDVSVYLMFSDKCIFEMFVWGDEQTMALLDIQKWKWEEGTYYKDFSMTRVEYRGQTYMTDFGFEPLDYKMWVPEYDVWTTTEFDNSTWSSTTPPPTKEESGVDNAASSYEYKPTTSTAPPTKKRFKTRLTTKRTTTTTITTTTKPTTPTTKPTTTTTKPTT